MLSFLLPLAQDNAILRDALFKDRDNSFQSSSIVLDVISAIIAVGLLLMLASFIVNKCLGTKDAQGRSKWW